MKSNFYVSCGCGSWSVWNHDCSCGCGDETDDHVGESAPYKDIKVQQILLSDAFAHPWTVVVHLNDTYPTLFAVFCPSVSH